MHTRRFPRLFLLLLGFTLAGCSGSGSSGFDISSENAAIDHVLTDQRCIDFEGLVICPAATLGPVQPQTATPSPTRTPILPTTTATPGRTNTPGSIPSTSSTPATTTVPITTATPTDHLPPTPPASPTRTATHSPTATHTATPTFGPTPPMQVDTAIDTSAPLVCNAGSCEFTIVFSAQGFEVGAEFFVAVRTTDPLGRWMIDPVPQLSSGPFGRNFQSPVAIGATDATPKVQIAILVFEAAPPSVPQDVAALGDTHADFAYVTSTVQLTAQR